MFSGKNRNRNREIRKAIDAAEHAFELETNAQHHHGGQLKGEEEDAWIIWIWYGATRPPRYCFYRVDKQTLEARYLENPGAWAPKAWR